MWCIVCGVWCIVCGMVYSDRYVVYGIWYDVILMMIVEKFLEGDSGNFS